MTLWLGVLCASALGAGFVRRHSNVTLPVDRAVAETLVAKAAHVDPNRAPQSVRGVDILDLLGASMSNQTRYEIEGMARWKVLSVGGKSWDSSWADPARLDQVLGAGPTSLVVEPTLKRGKRLPPNAVTVGFKPDPALGQPGADSPLQRHPVVMSYIQERDYVGSPGAQGEQAYFYPAPCLTTQKSCYCQWACEEYPPNCVPTCGEPLAETGDGSVPLNEATPVPTPPMPPPDTYVPVYDALYNHITGIKLGYDEEHTAMVAGITPLINKKPVVAKGESIMPLVVKILKDKPGTPLPSSIDWGVGNADVASEPSPFDLPPYLTTWEAQERVNLGAMEDKMMQTLGEDTTVAGIFLSNYQTLFNDLTKVGNTNQASTDNLVASARDEAIGVRSEDHNKMVEEENDVSTLLKGVAGDILVLRDKAMDQQSNLFERVSGTVTAESEAERVGAEALEGNAATAEVSVVDNEHTVKAYEQEVGDYLGGIEQFINSIAVDTLLDQEFQKVTQNITDADTKVEDEAVETQNELRDKLTLDVLDPFQKKYSEISSAATSLSFQYPTGWTELSVTPVTDKAQMAAQFNLASAQKMQNALAQLTAESRHIAQNVFWEVVRVAQQFESPDGVQFRAAEISPALFSDNFKGINTPAPLGTYQALSGWTVKDKKPMQEKIDQTQSALQIMADQSLAEMYKSASERLGAVKHEVGNTTVRLQEEVAEMKANETATVAKGAASAGNATKLAQDLEKAEGAAKEGNLAVSVLASEAKSQMESHYGTEVQSLEEGVQKYGENASQEVESAKAAVDSYLFKVKEPVEQDLPVVLNEIGTQLDTKSVQWTGNLTWLSEALKNLQGKVSLYYGGHKELNALHKMSDTEIGEANRNLGRNKKARSATHERLQEMTGMSTSGTELWVKNRLSLIAQLLRNAVRDRNGAIYDALAKVAKTRQAVDAAFKSNTQELRDGMKLTTKRVASLGAEVATTTQELAQNQQNLKDGVGAVKGSVRELIEAHKKTMKDASAAIASSLESTEAHNDLVYKDAESYVGQQLSMGTAATEKALGDSKEKIDSLFQEGMDIFNSKIAELSQDSDDMTFKAKTVGQILTEAYDTIASRAETLVNGADASIENGESSIESVLAFAEYMQTQLSSGAESELDFAARRLDRGKRVLEGEELAAAKTLAKYLQANGMSAQEALDAAADIIRSAADEVHGDEDKAARVLKALADHFSAAEAQVEDEAGAAAANETAAALGLDFDASQSTFASAEQQDRLIMEGTEQELADVEVNADHAGEELLAKTDEQARAFEEENAKSFETVEEAIQEGNRTLAEGRAELKTAGIQLRLRGHTLWDELTHYKNNVTAGITELNQLNADENFTLFKNARTLKAHNAQLLAMEQGMLKTEQDHIDQLQLQADKDFDATEVKIASFSQQVAQLMQGGAFQKLKKIQIANDDIAIVTRENEKFVQWLNETEQESVPWMQNVLAALGEAHEEKLKEDYKKAVLEKAMAAKEGAQVDGSFKSVEKMVQAAAGGSSSKAFGEMAKQDAALLSGMAAGSDRHDAAQEAELRAQMEQIQQDSGASMTDADSEVKATRSSTIDAGQGVAEVQHTLEHFVKKQEKNLQFRSQKVEQETGAILDSVMFPEQTTPDPAAWTDGYFHSGSLAQTHMRQAPASSFVEEGDTVNAADAVMWLNLLDTMHQLRRNYTVLSETNNELGEEVQKLAAVTV